MYRYDSYRQQLEWQRKIQNQHHVDLLNFRKMVSLAEQHEEPTVCLIPEESTSTSSSSSSSSSSTFSSSSSLSSFSSHSSSSLSSFTSSSSSSSFSSTSTSSFSNTFTPSCVGCCTVNQHQLHITSSGWTAPYTEMNRTEVLTKLSATCGWNSCWFYIYPYGSPVLAVFRLSINTGTCTLNVAIGGSKTGALCDQSGYNGAGATPYNYTWKTKNCSPLLLTFGPDGIDTKTYTVTT